MKQHTLEAVITMLPSNLLYYEVMSGISHIRRHCYTQSICSVRSASMQQPSFGSN